MDATTAAFLESWDRQSDIINRLAGSIDDDLMQCKPSEDGWTIAYHLCHIHEVRYFWLSRVSKKHTEGLGDVFTESNGEWIASSDLAHIRNELALSGRAVASAMRELIETGAGEVGGYSHPVMFMQHMIWHEGWHYGLIALAKRLAGSEAPEEWEEANVWGMWRTE